MKKTLLIAIITSFSFFSPAQIVVEAESGTLEGTIIESIDPGFSGSGYVNGFDADGDKFTISFDIPEKGTYTMDIIYSAGSYKEQRLSINDVFIGKIQMESTSGFESRNIGGAFLNTGTNTLSIEKDWGFVKIDNITFTLVPPHDYTLVTDLIDPNATDEAIATWDYLKENYGQKIITGQTHYYDELTSIAGKAPKQRAFDLSSYSNGYPYKWDNSIPGHSFGWEDDGTTQKILDWDDNTRGCGIASIQWHWHSPSGGLVSNNNFRTVNTTFDVSQAVIPGTPSYDLIIEDIDSIASQLKILQDNDIPILWRPLHEAGGQWFWWGAKGPEACLKLYDIMYDRLTNHHDLHNLIWVWSTPEEDWYPGNDKIDIFGYDSYPGAYVYGTQKNIFDQLFSICNGERLLAMTENGPIPDIDELFAQDAAWSYFSSWDQLVMEQNTTAHIQASYTNSRVINLTDSPCGISTGIEDELVSRVFPNPFNNYIDISNAQEYILYNSTGTIIKSGNEQIINTDFLDEGMYILELETGQRLKLIK